MDFKANLKGVKAKTEDERKATSGAAAQMDFRAVLGKKGGAGGGGGSGNKAVDPVKAPAKKNAVDDKKTGGGGEAKNGQGGEMANNCVKDGGGKTPSFTEKLSDVTVLDGQRLHLQCRLDAACDGSASWTLDGKLVKASKFIVLKNQGQHTHTHCPEVQSSTHRHPMTS